jgi:hypothetical protein
MGGGKAALLTGAILTGALLAGAFAGTASLLSSETDGSYSLKAYYHVSNHFSYGSGSQVSACPKPFCTFVLLEE